MNEMNPILYTIRPGDTLYNLAMQYGTTVQNIIDSNMALNPYNLRVGQQIYIYPHDMQKPSYWVSMNQVQLLKQMNLVWEQLIMWTRMLLISIAENLKDLEATQTRLLRNSFFCKWYSKTISKFILINIKTKLCIKGLCFITC